MSGRPIPGPRFWIDAARESREFLCLFALVADESSRHLRETGRGFAVKPGPLLVWAHRAPPTIDQLRRGAESTTAPPFWPVLLTRDWAVVQSSTFLWSVLRAIELAPTFGIESGRDICRVLAATAQALAIDTPVFRDHNAAIIRDHADGARALVARATTARHAPPPVVDVEPHDAEEARVETPDLTVLFASHIGPSSASKLENQDAVKAVTAGASAAFALADGVSTSLGARYAAESVVREFCARMRAALTAGGGGEAALLDAAAAARDRLDRTLDHLLEAGSDLSEVSGNLPVSSARRLLDNTRTAANPRLPRALSTTLLAGCLVPEGTSRFRATLIRIGDGVVEHVSATGETAVVFGMDAEATEIDSALSPGPLGQRSLSTAQFATVSFGPGDRLVASSDGLIRGQSGTLWSTVTELAGTASGQLPDARAVLEAAAGAADRAVESHAGSNLFQDNLSIVMVLSRARR